MKYKINNKIIKASTVLDAISQYNVRYNDERLSPSTYRALKALGVQPSQWRQMSQEQASEYISKRKNPTVAKSKESNNESDRQDTEAVDKLINNSLKKGLRSNGYGQHEYTIKTNNKALREDIKKRLEKQGYTVETGYVPWSNADIRFYKKADRAEEERKEKENQEHDRRVRNLTLNEINKVNKLEDLLTRTRYGQTVKSIEHDIDEIKNPENSQRFYFGVHNLLVDLDNQKHVDITSNPWDYNRVTVESTDENAIGRVVRALTLSGVPVELKKNNDTYSFTIKNENN